MPRPSHLADYVDALQARGQYVFHKEEALKALGPSTTPTGLIHALHRLANKGRVVRIRSGFYIIVPLEYRAAGTLPATWFIDSLMKSLGEDYYVGLLSAAALHGGAHQRPQEFQVVTGRPVRDIEVGSLRIAFITHTRVASVPTVPRKVETGTIRVSTPEATAVDLILFPERAGGLSNVATVLHELREAMKPEDLVTWSRSLLPKERPALQRLGFLLRFVGDVPCEEVLHKLVMGRSSRKADNSSSSLPAVLASVPDQVFWKRSSRGHRVPDFNAVFAWYLRRRFPDEGLPAGEVFREIEKGRTVNLSTFQRSVAAEGRRRAPTVPLRPDLPVRDCPTDPRWGVIINEEVEADL